MTDRLATVHRIPATDSHSFTCHGGRMVESAAFQAAERLLSAGSNPVRGARPPITYNQIPVSLVRSGGK